MQSEERKETKRRVRARSPFVRLPCFKLPMLLAEAGVEKRDELNSFFSKEEEKEKEEKNR